MGRPERWVNRLQTTAGRHLLSLILSCWLGGADNVRTLLLVRQLPCCQYLSKALLLGSKQHPGLSGIISNLYSIYYNYTIVYSN